VTAVSAFFGGLFCCFCLFVEFCVFLSGFCVLVTK
jgi:hypothetical protein